MLVYSKEFLGFGFRRMCHLIVSFVIICRILDLRTVGCVTWWAWRSNLFLGVDFCSVESVQGEPCLLWEVFAAAVLSRASARKWCSGWDWLHALRGHVVLCCVVLSYPYWLLKYCIWVGNFGFLPTLFSLLTLLCLGRPLSNSCLLATCGSLHWATFTSPDTWFITFISYAP